jgi:Domain of unknown function (DUF4397)
VSDAAVTVVHGFPNTPVDVYVNGQLTLLNFQFKTVTSSLSLPAGTYHVDVRPAGAASTGIPMLSASGQLSAGENATIVANLSATGTPELTAFANPATPAPPGDAWVLVRHTAQAPAVDVYAGSTKVISDPLQPQLGGPARRPCRHGASLGGVEPVHLFLDAGAGPARSAAGGGSPLYRLRHGDAVDPHGGSAELCGWSGVSCFGLMTSPPIAAGFAPLRILGLAVTALLTVHPYKIPTTIGTAQHPSKPDSYMPGRNLGVKVKVGPFSRPY